MNTITVLMGVITGLIEAFCRKTQFHLQAFHHQTLSFVTVIPASLHTLSFKVIQNRTDGERT